MKVKELIERLQQFGSETEVMILDGFNGGGEPRELNLGPHRYVVSRFDTIATADCEGKNGDTVVILGYGCY